jgi:predicted permease
VIAGAIGLLFTIWARQAVSTLEPLIPIPVSLQAGINFPVLLFTFLASVFTGALFGLAPALQSTRLDLAGIIKEESALNYRRSRLRNSLVIAQVALSLLLLIGSGLFIRSLNHASGIDPGFQTNHLLLLSVDLATQGYKEADGQNFYDRALERLSRLNNVKSVSLAEVMDLGIAGQRRAVTIEGYKRQNGEEMEIDFNRVGPSFFETMQIPILRGRSFRNSDREGALPVVIVNETFASRYWPGQEAIGKRLSIDETNWLQVIGIAKNAKYRTLGEEPRPYYYVPMFQDYQGSATLIVQTKGNPLALSHEAQKELASIDRTLPVFDVETGNDHLHLALLPAQIAGGLLGIFGALALTLAAIGIYGVMSYGVSQRTKEIGIRIAIGAQRKDVLRLILAQGMRLAFIGILIGFAGAFAVTRFASTFLYGVSPQDPVTFFGIAAILCTVAFLACYIPAKRAVSVDPMVALRYE